MQDGLEAREERRIVEAQRRRPRGGAEPQAEIRARSEEREGVGQHGHVPRGKQEAASPVGEDAGVAGEVGEQAEAERLTRHDGPGLLADVEELAAKAAFGIEAAPADRLDGRRRAACRCPGGCAWPSGRGVRHPAVVARDADVEQGAGLDVRREPHGREILGVAAVPALGQHPAAPAPWSRNRAARDRIAAPGTAGMRAAGVPGRAE